VCSFVKEVDYLIATDQAGHPPLQIDKMVMLLIIRALNGEQCG